MKNLIQKKLTGVPETRSDTICPGVELSGPAQGSLEIHALGCIYPTAEAAYNEQDRASEIQERGGYGGKMRENKDVRRTKNVIRSRRTTKE